MCWEKNSVNLVILLKKVNLFNKIVKILLFHSIDFCVILTRYVDFEVKLDGDRQ